MATFPHARPMTPAERARPYRGPRCASCGGDHCPGPDTDELGVPLPQGARVATDAERAELLRVERDEARATLRLIAGELWPADTPDPDDWGADALDAVADIVRRAGYGGTLVLSSRCYECGQEDTHAPSCSHVMLAPGDRDPMTGRMVERVTGPPEDPTIVYTDEPPSAAVLEEYGLTPADVPGTVEPDAAVNTCPVCDRTAAAGTHPCRFATACSCWRGVPCQLEGDPRDLG